MPLDVLKEKKKKAKKGPFLDLCKMARVHHLVKGHGYGFHLASEKGAQYIRKIDPDSPAERSGIKDGDRLLGVSLTQHYFSGHFLHRHFFRSMI